MLKANSVSGDFALNNSIIENNVDVDSVSGNIVIDNNRVLRLFAQKEIKVKLRHYTLTKAGKEIFTLTEADKKQFIKQ